MTKRELYTAVVEGRITDEVIEGFKAEIPNPQSPRFKINKNILIFKNNNLKIIILI